MKTLRNCLLAASLAVLGLWTVSASAAVVFFGSYAGDDTYIGSYDPAVGDSGTFGNGQIETGLFEDTWVFYLSADGMGTVNANFLPEGDIAVFTVMLSVVSGGCDTTAVGELCTASLGSTIRTGTTGTNSSNIDWTSLPTGYYGIVVSGDVTGNEGASYSGQLRTNVPEPTVLALLGLGLAGLGFSRRRKQ